MRAILGICLAFVAPINAQQNPAARAARQWRETHERAILGELASFLSIPNLADDQGNLRRSADAAGDMLENRGVKVQMLQAAGSPPLVFGEIRTPGATRTLVFYAHYDGQAVDPKEWTAPPFQPKLPPDGPVDPEWRIYARSSSDDKASIVAMASALDGLRSAGVPLRSNVKFVFEGEEEQGSPHLEEILARNKDLLRGDVWLICDGPIHPSRRQQVVFGARGFTTMDITVYGARHELHSGQYANWAPNPARMLARLIASMQDDEGRILLEHFYDGIVPLSDDERHAIAAAPDADASLMRELWLGRTEGGGKKLVEMINMPSFNVRGIGAGKIGEQATNVLPTKATASLDLRLVKGMDHAQTVQRVIDHVRKQGYYVIETEPDAQVLMSHAKVARITIGKGGYNASRTSMDLPISKELLATAESARGAVVKLPTIGGSLPLYMIEGVLGAPAVMIPIANHDNNQHSANENLRIQNLWDGIELIAALLTM
jgi:acetylornithine deacetylase/succinyl-diaminopimelate desuccinylase-like protein